MCSHNGLRRVRRSGRVECYRGFCLLWEVAVQCLCARNWKVAVQCSVCTIGNAQWRKASVQCQCVHNFVNAQLRKASVLCQCLRNCKRTDLQWRKAAVQCQCSRICKCTVECSLLRLANIRLSRAGGREGDSSRWSKCYVADSDKYTCCSVLTCRIVDL